MSRKIKTEVPESGCVSVPNDVTLIKIDPNKPEVTIKLSEYLEINKKNFIANTVMQYLYNNCKLNYDKNGLDFNSYGIENVLAAVDKEYYDKVLEIKQKEAESEAGD